MIRDWLGKITFGIASLGVLFLCLSLWYSYSRPKTIPPKPAIAEKQKLPKRSFSFEEEAYHKLGEPILSLKETTATLQLPDLRQQLVYYGRNGRPDAQAELIMLNFGLLSSKSSASIAPGEKLYLTFDRTQKPAKFIFSPKNEKSSLWLEASPKGNEASVQIKMVNETGKVIQTPPAHANFNLKEKDQSRVGKSWDLGKWRVDATLLSRQKARWFGQDSFLAAHGGEEFASTVGKERIDFTEEENLYSVYAKEKGILVWSEGRWREPLEGEDTTGFPLLVVKKISDRVMNLELWDVEGKGKVNLNLLKSTDMKIPPGIQKNFKFVGAKTRSQFIFEINKERMVLKPKDWLLLTKKGWIKLITPEQIDDYVNRKLTGPLFIFDGVVKKGDTQIISGTLFNASRTDMQPVELPVQQSRAVSAPEAPPEKKPEVNSEPSEKRPIRERERPPLLPNDRPSVESYKPEKTPLKE